MRDYEYNVLVLYCASVRQAWRMVDWAEMLGLNRNINYLLHGQPSDPATHAIVTVWKKEC